MLVAAAVCPHPPLLIPEVAAGAAAELDELRAACDEAVRRVLAVAPDTLIVVGAGDPGVANRRVEYGRTYTTRRFATPGTGDLRPDAWGTLAGYGIPVEASLGGSSGPPLLPLSLTVGAWLLRRCGWAGPRAAFAVAVEESRENCVATGAEIAQRAARVGLLVMGDGSACRTEKAPGYLDERAEPFDVAVATALGKPDPEGLLALDADLALDLKAAGRAPWQVLAGASGAGSYDADLLYDDAPYGVGYLVASWTAA